MLIKNPPHIRPDIRASLFFPYPAVKGLSGAEYPVHPYSVLFLSEMAGAVNSLSMGGT